MLDDAFADAGGNDRVVDVGVGANNHQAAGPLEVLVGIGGVAAAEHLHHRRDGGGVAEAGAVVDVVGSEDGAGELLDDEAILAGGLGRADDADSAVEVGQTVGGPRQRFFPGRGAERFVAAIADERGGQPLRAVDEAEAEATLDAEAAAAGEVLRHVVDLDDLAALADVEDDAAADAAVGAGRFDPALDPGEAVAAGAAGVHFAPEGGVEGRGWERGVAVRRALTRQRRGALTPSPPPRGYPARAAVEGEPVVVSRNGAN